MQRFVLKAADEPVSQEEGDEENAQPAKAESGPDFNYLLNMPLWNLTKEKKDELLKNRDAKAEELSKLRHKTPTDLWREDLKAFLDELEVCIVPLYVTRT
jgi:DNA topoisomerase-2